MKSTTTVEENVKEFKGDGLQVNMDYNDLNLRVSGDGCRVTVIRNSGKIRVVGDGCSLKVNRNDGKIEYKGDGGCIQLGNGSTMESVSYVGDGGRISVKNALKNSRKEKKEKTTKSDDSADGAKVKKSGCSLSDSELEVKRDNETNHIKEAKEMKKNNYAEQKHTENSIKQKKRNLQRSKTIFVTTKISTEFMPVIVSKNDLIKNWFRSPPTVVRSLKSSCTDSL